MLMRRRIRTIRRGILLGVLMAVSVAAAALAAGTFTDDDGNTHEANIEAIAAEGITKGCNPPVNDLYCPSDPVTRGQMAAFLRRAFDLPAAVEDHFTDDDGTTFEGDINALAEAGITKGCNPPANTEYCPDGHVTRGQMAAFLRRAFDYPAVTNDFFTDDDNSIFEADINAIAAEGVTKGCNPPDNTLYCPNDLVLRDQMASFLARALELKPIVPEHGQVCDFSTGSSEVEDVVVDLEGDGVPETVELAISQDDRATMTIVTSAETIVHTLGGKPFPLDDVSGSLVVKDVTGDGLLDVAACTRLDLINDSLHTDDVAIASAHNGSPQVVMDPSVLRSGEVRGGDGELILKTTDFALSGDCIWLTSTTYQWDGLLYVPSGLSVSTVTDSHEDCSDVIAAAAKNEPPTPGFILGFTDLGAVEGETLLVEGPDAGSLVQFCEGPGSLCGQRSSDSDGTIENWFWFLNGELFPWTAPGDVDMAVFDDGLNTVTLMVFDDDGSETYATGYVFRNRG